jgi:diguanylate cyclase (GGDEF)-like protein
MFPAARTILSHRSNASIADQTLYFTLVRTLYSTPKSIFSATVAALIITGLTGELTGDRFYAAFLAGFLITGIGRSGLVLLYHHSRHDPNDPVAIQRWELGALVGAWAFAGLVGLIGAYTVTFHPGTDVEILTTGCVMGYIAGTSSRNASRPRITIGQISFTCVPFALALILRGDLVHVALAIFICVLYISTIVICRTVFDNIVSRHEAFRKIEILAQQDALTGLWNRAAFLHLLEQRLAATAETRDTIALIAIDLDRFKGINDTLGHPAGDAVLKETADRIRSAVRPGDEISRIGGDEFLVLLAGVDCSEVDAAAQRILAKFSNPFTISMTNNMCGASIGYAIAPIDGCTLDVLLRNADLALYEAKKRGRGQIAPYSPALSHLHERRITLEHDLQFALSNGELEILYQPVVDPRSGRVTCCEALLRWNHPELGTIAPSVFIPIAEATSLIVPIGTWVLNRACADATRWSADTKVAVNLSPVQFRRGREIVDIVVTALSQAELSPNRLELEITETVLIEDSDATLAVLNELRNRGIGVALDDLGTGFSSFAYLNDFRFSKVKIDRKFSQHADQSPRTSAIIKGIAQTTRDLGIELVAEGVETAIQLERMRSLGIDAIQGYVFSKPLTVLQLQRMIYEPILPPLVQHWRTETSSEQVGARRALS